MLDIQLINERLENGGAPIPWIRFPFEYSDDSYITIDGTSYLLSDTRIPNLLKDIDKFGNFNLVFPSVRINKGREGDEVYENVRITGVISEEVEDMKISYEKISTNPLTEGFVIKFEPEGSNNSPNLNSRGNTEPPVSVIEKDNNSITETPGVTQEEPVRSPPNLQPEPGTRDDDDNDEVDPEPVRPGPPGPTTPVNPPIPTEEEEPYVTIIEDQKSYYAEHFSHREFIKNLQEEPIDVLVKTYLKYFFNESFHPNINGVTLAFMVPPHFSGTDKRNNRTPYDLLSRGFHSYMMHVNDITTPSLDVTTSTIGTTGDNAISYVTNLKYSGEITISYTDNKTLRIYDFHEEWMNYIYRVMKGKLIPHEKYKTTKTIDYLASIYILRLDSDLKTHRYIAKATGVFPKTLPSKEIIGTKNDGQMVQFDINYECSSFNSYVLHPRIKQDYPPRPTNPT